MRYGENCRSGTCKKGKCSTKLRGWKLQELIMRHQITTVEFAGVQGKCGTRSPRVEYGIDNATYIHVEMG